MFGFVDKITNIRKKHLKEFNNKYIEQTGSYEDNKQAIDNLGLLDKDAYSPEFIERGIICLTPNARKEQDNIELSSIIHIPIFKLLPEYKDVTFIHEIGHAIELELIKASEEQMTFKTGFEYHTEKFNVNSEINEDEEQREFEMMSEVIHQKIAIEVAQNLHEKGIYLIGDPKKEREVGGVSYERNYIIVKDYYEKYREDIIQARMYDKECRNLKTKIPYENIKKLNELVNEYSKLPHYAIFFANQEGRTIPEMAEKQRLLEEQKELMEIFEKQPEEQTTDNSELLLASAIEATEISTRSGAIEKAVNECIGERKKATKERGEI